jgi:hypothetical protein
LVQEEICVLGADMNGHVGAEEGTYDNTYVGRGFGTRNEEGNPILENNMAAVPFTNK